MIQAIERVRLVSAPTDARAHRLAASLGMSVTMRSIRIVIHERWARVPIARVMSRALRKVGYVKHFEDTYLRGRMRTAARSQFVGAFFNVISKQYSRVIHHDLNIACYERLLDVASSVTRRKANFTCLDLGCGPATILLSRVPLSTDSIVGYDFSSKMRRLAAQQGLVVMSSNEFWRPSQNFQVILSCYVLHYRTASCALLECIADHLAAGAVWVANFHKRIGLDDFLLLLAQTPRLMVVRGPIDSPYGPIIAISRVA